MAAASDSREPTGAMISKSCSFMAAKIRLFSELVKLSAEKQFVTIGKFDYRFLPQNY
jgi:hypothetical protein